MKTILGLALGLVVAGGAQAACSAADQAALEKFDKDWSKAAQAGDRAAMSAFYAEEYMDLQPGAVTGRDYALDGATKAAAELKASGKPAPDLHHDFYQIQCTANSALITHRNWGVVGEGDKATTWNTRSIHQLEKRDGRWVVVGNATHPVSDEQRLGWLDLEWNQAELAGDTAWFERTLADNFIGISSRTGARDDKAATIASIGKSKVAVADTTDMETFVEGDHAMVTGIYTTRGTDDKGKAFDHRLRYIDTFVKRDGRWQMTSSQGTDITE
jgi:ketosteroid isomerase-like protein